MQADFLWILLPALIAALFWRRRAGPRAATGVPRRAIVVDGSNVMHWSGAPSVKVLARVLRALEAQGYAPVVFFDANAGHVLFGRYLGPQPLAKAIGLPQARVHVVDKGVIADQALLAFAARHRLRVVSNDQFRDWRVPFPHLVRKGSVLRGTFRDGAVVWRGR